MMLWLDELVSGYHGGAVLHQVSGKIPAGTVYAVVGQNGAGKTTLLHTIAGLVSVTAGKIHLDGREVQSWPAYRRARRGLGYVPQGRRVYPSLTVAEHLAIARRGTAPGAGWNRRAISELFPQLGNRLHHHGGQLSGGEQQMLAIARALLHQPTVLLMDEPVEGLAPSVAGQIRDIITVLAGQGIAVLLTAPQPELAVAVADHIAVLHAGQVEAEFDGEAVRRDDTLLKGCAGLSLGAPAP